MAALRPLLDQVAAHYLTATAAGVDGESLLTPRERTVLRLLAQGSTAASVAHRLGVSPRTVEKHLERCYRKLGVRDRLSAVRIIAELGLVRDTAADAPKDGQLF